MHYLLKVAPPRASPSQSQSQTQTPEDSVPEFDPADNPNPAPLSAQEAAFLHAHQTLLAGHFGASFLNSFPPQLRRLDDNAGGTSMVQGPEVREAVVVRCLVEEVRVVIPPGDGIEEELFGTTMRMGDVWVVRWEGIKKAWEKGEVEVL